MKYKLERKMTTNEDVHILSWDCGHRTLSWVYLIFHRSALLKLYQAVERLNDSKEDKCKTLIEISDLVGRVIEFHDYGINDISGKKIGNEFEQAEAVQNHLAKFKYANIAPVAGAKLLILIEQQPRRFGTFCNKFSSVIGNYLLYHYVSLRNVYGANYEVALISPKHKTTIAFAPELRLACEKTGKANADYRARKACTTANMERYMKIFGIAPPDCSHSKLNNIADAFMQAMYYIVWDM